MFLSRKKPLLSFQYFLHLNAMFHAEAFEQYFRMQGLWWNTTRYAWKLERETVIIAYTVRSIWIDPGGDVQISLKLFSISWKKGNLELSYLPHVTNSGYVKECNLLYECVIKFYENSLPARGFNSLLSDRTRGNLVVVKRCTTKGTRLGQV